MPWTFPAWTARWPRRWTLRIGTGLFTGTSSPATYRSTQPRVAVTVCTCTWPISGSVSDRLLGVFSDGLGREFALAPDGKTVLLTDNNAGRLQATDVTSLP